MIAFSRKRTPVLVPAALAAVLCGGAAVHAQAPDGAGAPPEPGVPHPSLRPGDSLAIEVVGVSVALPGSGGPAGEEGDRSGRRSPNLLLDGGLLLGGTTAYVLVRNKHRGFILERGSIDNVLANFRRPVRRALEGSDNDSFLTNYVAHPLTWGSVALYLQYRGYSDHAAFALSQAYSVFWEYVVEGSYTTPSGRDMVTNFFSAAAVVYGLPLLVGEIFPGPDPESDEGAWPAGRELRVLPLLASGPGGLTVHLEFELR